MTAITLPGFTRSATAGGLPLAQAFASGAGVRLTGSTSGTVDLFPPATVTTPYTLTLPAALGASDKLIQVSSTGVMSLVDAPSTVPAGTGTEIQYRNAGAFGAVAGSSWNGSELAINGKIGASSAGFRLTSNNGAWYVSGGVVRFDFIGISQISCTSNWSLGITASAKLFIGKTYTGNPVYYHSTLEGSVIIGGSPSNTVYIGNDTISGGPQSGIIKGTGGSGSNIVGGNLVFAPGPSTGNATPSSIILQSTVATTSGSTAQTLFAALTLRELTLTCVDALNIAFSATTGTKLGTSNTQKLSLWNSTPIVQPTTGYSEATFVQNSGDAINANSTFDGYTLRQVVAALRGMGALA